MRVSPVSLKVCIFSRMFKRGLAYPDHFFLSYLWFPPCTTNKTEKSGLAMRDHVQARVKSKTPKLHTSSYVHAWLTSKFIDVHIFSHVITIALEQHASFRKNVTETNASLMRACVKFRLSCTVSLRKLIKKNSTIDA